MIYAYALRHLTPEYLLKLLCSLLLNLASFCVELNFDFVENVYDHRTQYKHEPQTTAKLRRSN